LSVSSVSIGSVSTESVVTLLQLELLFSSSGMISLKISSSCELSILARDSDILCVWLWSSPSDKCLLLLFRLLLLLSSFSSDTDLFLLVLFLVAPD